MSHRRYRCLTMTDIELWPSLDPFALDTSLRDDFIRKRAAVFQYAQGVSLNDIKKDTGVSRQHLYYLLDRCGSLALDGKVMGFRALLKERVRNFV